MLAESPAEKPKPKRWWTINETRVAIVITWFVVCWFIGASRGDPDLSPFFERAWPEAHDFVKLTETVYEARSEGGEVLGYVATAAASGYGGPLEVVVAVSPQGKAQSLAVVRHRETPTFFDRALKGRILDRLVGKTYEDRIALDDDVDGVSGATYTCLGMTQSVRRAVHTTSRNQLKLPVEESKRRIVFGLPEIVLILLFVVSISKRRFRLSAGMRRWLRWATLLTGLVFVGFVFNNPFVIAHLNMIMVGYWPDWQTHLYWYILVVGLLLFKATEEWNLYCYDFCPFGAAQDVLGKIGGARPRKVRWPTLLLWLQRGLCIAAISLALIYRNPGFSSFEIFGTMFRLDGTNIQFALLAIVVLVSLFIYRPWCRYLCPLHKNTAEGLFEKIRRIITQTWKSLLPKTAT